MQLDCKENASYGAVQRRRQLLSQLRAHYSQQTTPSPPLVHQQNGETAREDPLPGEARPKLTVEEVLEQFSEDYSDLIAGPPKEVNKVKGHHSTW